MNSQPSLMRRVFGAGAALAFAAGTTMFVGCGDDSNPTDPGPGDDPGLAFSGSGASALPRIDFVATSASATAQSFVWTDDGSTPLRSAGGNIVTLVVTPDSGNPAIASSSGLTFGSTTWTATGGVSGIDGITISSTSVDFDQVDMSDGTTTVTMDGFLAIPTATLPLVPTGVVASADDAAVDVSWGAVSGATSYNVYWATEAGVTASNYTTLENGATASVTSGTTYEINPATPEVRYYVVVTAENAAGESAASTEVSAIPTDPNAPFMTLTLAGSGAASFPGTTFTPLSSWPGSNQQAVYLWNDPVSGAVLAVNFDRDSGRTTMELVSIYVYTDTQTWGAVNLDDGIVGTDVGVGTFSFTNVSLAGENGETTTLILSGVLGRGTVVSPGGTVAFTGDTVVAGNAMTANDTNVIASSAVIEFEDTTNNVTIRVDIGNTPEGVNSIVVSNGTQSWSTDPFDTADNVVLDGNDIVFNNQVCDFLEGGATTAITLNGTLTW